MNTPKRRQPELTRDAILDAAQALFLEQGVHATSTSQIASRASVTKSLIHHHFGSKEELWIAVKRRAFGDYFEQQKRILESGPPGPELIRSSLTHYFRMLSQNPEHVRMLIWINMEPDTCCQEMEYALFELGLQRLREAQSYGLLRPDLDPVHIFIAMLSLIESWFQRCNHFHAILRGAIGESSPVFNHEAYLDDILKLIFEGIGPQS